MAIRHSPVRRLLDEIFQSILNASLAMSAKRFVSKRDVNGKQWSILLVHGVITTVGVA
jgi:hypothetical protein